MKQAIIGIRYFECEEYARDFVEGRIFFNSAGKFENIKNQEQHYVEGRVPCYSREIVINGEKIVGDICYTLYYEEDKRVPICCFSYITPDDFKNGVYLTEERMKGIYKYFVVFNIGDLLSGLSKKLLEAGCGLCARPVEYFNFSDSTNPWGNLDLSDIPVNYRKFFIHSNKNEHQREFRIVITHRLFDYEGANAKVDITPLWSSLPLKICKLS
jgi:hypothetical protein